MTDPMSRDFKPGDSVLVEARVVAAPNPDADDFDPVDVHLHIIGAFGPPVILRVYPNAPVGRVLRGVPGEIGHLILPPSRS